MNTTATRQAVIGAVLAAGVAAAAEHSNPFPADLKELRPIEVKNSRNMRFAEYLIINPEGYEGAETFNTGNNEVPADIAKRFDIAQVKKQYRAEGVILNGPKYWMCDSHTIWLGAEVDFGEVDSLWVGTLPVDGLDEEGGKPFEIYTPEKIHRLVYMAGKPVYELVDDVGHAYALQARSDKVPMEWLPTLGERLDLPEGWSYRTRVLEKDLVLDLGPRATIYNVGDNFHQYYQRIPESENPTAASVFPAAMKELKPLEMTGIRNMRFAEIIVVRPGGIDGAEGFNTATNEVPAELWDKMDVEKLKADFDAEGIILNGPKYWMMDSQSLSFGGTINFGGIDQLWVATHPPSGLDKEGGKPYQIYNPTKTQRMVYDAGKQVHELVDSDGHAYVLQARAEQFPIEELSSLGEKLKRLPEGWSYRTRVLEEDLVLDLGPHMTAHAVGDEFYQYYTRIPEN